MRNQKSSPFRSLIFFCLLLVLTACSFSTNPASDQNGGITPTDSIPTATQPPPNPLVICLGEAPNTLFPYGRPNRSSQQVLQAIYDGPIDHRNYEFQSVILENLPSLANENANLQTAEVAPGQKVLDDSGNVTILDFGTFVRPSGCYSSDCAVAYDGSPMIMDQMIVLFNMRSDIVWADGAPLTSADSVYGFYLDSSYSSQSENLKLERTASYDAVTEYQTLWTGIPGYIDKKYQDNFWLPVPQHLWGSLNPEELLTAQQSSQMPTGYGPFSIVSWENNQIILQKNPNYFRSSENLPLADQLIFNVVGQDSTANLQMLLSGECDILDKSASQGIGHGEILEMQNQGQLLAAWTDGDAWELINFGIQPRSYDDGYSMWASDRANFFGDPRTRQAIAMCIDRQKIVQESTNGLSKVMNTYIPPGHFLSNPNAASYVHDPTTAATLLDEVGWLMRGDGVREAVSIPDIFNGTLFSIDYAYLDNPQSEAIAQIVAEGLAQCGIQVNLTPKPAEELWAYGPDALVFGRQFDLAQFPWQAAEEPSCYLFISEAIPGEDLEVFPQKWGGWNMTGWANEEFDAACIGTRSGAPGLDDYIKNHYTAQEIFAEQLPAIPLFTYQNIILTRPDICGLEFDPTAGFSWNLEKLGYGELCK